jgi:hypothetical protein
MNIFCPVCNRELPKERFGNISFKMCDWCARPTKQCLFCKKELEFDEQWVFAIENITRRPVCRECGLFLAYGDSKILDTPE